MSQSITSKRELVERELEDVLRDSHENVEENEEYLDEDVELRQLEFTLGTAPSGGLAVIGFGSLIYTGLVLVNGNVRSTFFPSVAIGIICCLASAFALFIRFTSPQRYLRVLRGAIALVLCLFTAIAIVVEDVSRSNGECNDPAVEVDKRKAYLDANCDEFYNPWPILTMMIVVMARLSGYATLGLSVVFTATVAITSIAVYQPNEAVRIATSPFIAVCCAALTLLRYSAENDEVNRFEQSEELKSRVAELKEKKQDLEEYCQRMLPPAVLERTRRGMQQQRVVDVCDNAAVLVFGMHDFGRECIERRPVDVAGLIEKIRTLLATCCEKQNLQRVSILQDEFIAVGNLINRVGQGAALSGCCLAALDALKRLNSPALKSPPCLQVGIHAGPVVGAFIGRTWVRYDVVGEGVSTCRAIRHAAAPKTAVVSDFAYHLGRDFIQAEEAGCVEDESSTDISASSTDISASSTDIRASSGGKTIVIHRLVSCDPEAAMSLDGSNSGSSMINSRGNSRHSSTAENPFSAVVRFTDASNTGDVMRARVWEESYSMGTNEHEEIAWDAIASAFGVFRQFVLPSTEVRYQEYRLQAFANRGVIAWSAAAGLQLVAIILTLADFRGNTASAGIVVLTLAAVLSASMAMLPSVKSNRVLLDYPLVWVVAVFVSSLATIYGLALTRPSPAGNSLELYFVMGAMLYSSVFLKPKLLLVAKPVFLVLALLQHGLPGGYMRLGFTLGSAMIVLVSLVGDRDVDRADRKNFIVLKRLEELSDLLQQERLLREGLLESTLPATIRNVAKEAMESGEQAICVSIPDTAVVTVCWRGSPTPLATGKSTTSELVALLNARLESLSTTLNDFPQLTISSLGGDRAVLVDPVSSTVVSGRDSDASVFGSVLAARRVVEVAAALGVSEEGGTSAIVDCDDTVQITRLQGLPTFSVLGIGVTRMLALVAAVDWSMLHGVMVTDRVKQRLETSTFVESNRVLIQPMPSWRIRGVGMVKLHHLASNSNSD